MPCSVRSSWGTNPLPQAARSKIGDISSAGVWSTRYPQIHSFQRSFVIKAPYRKKKSIPPQSRVTPNRRKIPLLNPSFPEQLLHLGNSDTTVPSPLGANGWRCFAESLSPGACWDVCRLPCRHRLQATAWGGRFGEPRNLPALHLLFISMRATTAEKAIKPLGGSGDRCHADQTSSWKTLGESVILWVLPAWFHSSPDTEILVQCQF